MTSSGAMDGWSRSHDDIGTSVKGVADGAGGNPNLFDSHGAISQPMLGAQNAVDTARGEALGAAHTASTTIAGLLAKANKMYQEGDTAGAEQVRAQAAKLEAAQSGGAAGAGAAAGAAGGGGAAGQGGGAQQASQMMGQFGQMVGQVMQGVTQPIQGLAQSLGQLPQQVMQGVQGMAQAAGQGGGAAAGAAGGGAAAGGAGAASERAEKEKAEKAEKEREEREHAGAQAEAGSKAGEKAPLMSRERMREMQGLPPEAPGRHPRTRNIDL